MSITHIGVENVAKYIEQVKPGKFKIYTDVSKVPIYASTTKDLVTEFIEFSSNIQNNKDGSVYKIALFVPHGGKATADRIISETYFTYHADPIHEVETTKPIGAVGSMTEMFSLMSTMMKFVQPFASQKAENEILKSELENTPEDNNSMANIISSVLPLLIPKPGVGVAGVDVSEVQSPTLTKALEILIKNDPNLSEHLMKLAELSENNPTLFNTLINQLSIL